MGCSALPARDISHAPYDCTDVCDYDELVLLAREVFVGDGLLATEPGMVGGEVTHRRLDALTVCLEMESGGVNVLAVDAPVTVLREAR